MKYRILIIALLMLLAQNMTANDKIEKAFNSFIKSTQANLTKGIKENGDNGIGEIYCYEYNFAIPEKDIKKVRSLGEKMSKEQDAKKFIMNEPGSEKQIGVAYGADLNHYYSLSGTSGYYILIKPDLTNTKNRYAYILSWAENVKENSQKEIIGYATKIYSADPDQCEDKVKNNTQFYFQFRDPDTEEAKQLRTEIREKAKEAREKLRTEAREKAEEAREKAKKASEKAKVARQHINDARETLMALRTHPNIPKEEKEKILEGYGQVMEVAEETMEKSRRQLEEAFDSLSAVFNWDDNPADYQTKSPEAKFLLEFNAAVKVAESWEGNNALIKLYDICKNVPAELPPAMTKYCLDELTRLSRSTTDSFQQSLLEEAKKNFK